MTGGWQDTVLRLVRRDPQDAWVHMLAAAYTAGALGVTERTAFERHLPGCPRCTREVRTARRR